MITTTARFTPWSAICASVSAAAPVAPRSRCCAARTLGTEKRPWATMSGMVAAPSTACPVGVPSGQPPRVPGPQFGHEEGRPDDAHARSIGREHFAVRDETYGARREPNEVNDSTM